MGPCISILLFTLKSTHLLPLFLNLTVDRVAHVPIVEILPHLLPESPGFDQRLHVT